MIMALFAYNIVANVKEGLDSCGPGTTNKVEQQTKRCASINSQVQQSALINVQNKFDKLKKLFNNTQKQISSVQEQASKNMKNLKSLEKVAEGKGETNKDACKKYPEAC